MSIGPGACRCLGGIIYRISRDAPESWALLVPDDLLLIMHDKGAIGRSGAKRSTEAHELLQSPMWDTFRCHGKSACSGASMECSSIISRGRQLAALSIHALEEMVHSFHHVPNVLQVDREVRKRDLRSLLVL
jgi:hypothetical protein